MEKNRSIWVGCAVIAAALAIRLMAGGLLQPLTDFFARQEVAAFLLRLESGRELPPSKAPLPTQPPETPDPPSQTEPAAQDTLPATDAEAAVAVFAPEDAQRVQISTLAGYRVDIPAMLNMPLQWELKQAQPTVLILHSHATESYTQTAGWVYRESSAYRTLDSAHNMLRVGEHLKNLLEAEGVRVIHDRTLHDHPDYNGAYTSSRKAAQAYLEQYPSLCLVLDLHRDAAELSNQVQLSTHATVDGQNAAQLMFVIGTDGTGLQHPRWQENMALAVKLQAWLERQSPGLCRPINFRAQRFNQDLSPGAMIVEVGAAGDTLEEALVACEMLARGITALSEGATASFAS